LPMCVCAFVYLCLPMCVCARACYSCTYPSTNAMFSQLHAQFTHVCMSMCTYTLSILSCRNQTCTHTHTQIHEKMEQMFGNLVHPGNPTSMHTGPLGQPADIHEWRAHIRNLARLEVFGGAFPGSENDGSGSPSPFKYVDPYEVRKKEVRMKGAHVAVKNMADVPR
jgi:hypothetical protein